MGKHIKERDGMKISATTYPQYKNVAFGANRGQLINQLSETIRSIKPQNDSFTKQPPLNGNHSVEADFVKEPKSLINALRKKLLEETNPVAPENFQRIKNQLDCISNDQIYKSAVQRYETPYELWEKVHSFGFKFTYDAGELVDLITPPKRLLQNPNKILTPENIERYKKLAREYDETNKKFIDILTPKSSDPKVLKLEEQVRALGIKNVNFSDDLPSAKMIKQAIIDLLKFENIPLPDTIIVTGALKSIYGGIALRNLDEKAIIIGNSKRLAFAKSSQGIAKKMFNSEEFQALPAKIKESIKEKFRLPPKNSSSTTNPKHTVFHEVGHLTTESSLAERINVLTKKELQTAEEISLYAAKGKNGIETVAEIFAKLMDGQTLTAKQMELYLKLGGIVPKLKKLV